MERVEAMEQLCVLRYGLRHDQANKETNEQFIEALGVALDDMGKMHLAMLYDDFRHGRDYEEEEANGNV